MAKSIAVLTGGGCAPGLDPFLEAFAKTMTGAGYTVLGVKYGWEGLLGKEPDTINLDWEAVEGAVRSGGTMIGTSRANPFPEEDKEEKKAKVALANLEKLKVEGLVAAGGDDTLTVASKLHERGIKVIGVPKTMDLDLSGTDYSVGFWAYNEAVFRMAVPGFIETLKAHHRVGVLELFGRHSGFTVVAAGIAGGACYIAIKEMEVDLDQVVARVNEFYQRNKWALVAVGEAVELETEDKGKIDDHGNELLFQRRIGEFLARQIEQMTGIESRAFQATHPFRGTPSAYDSVIGFRLGLKAAEMVQAGQWGEMASVQGNEIGTASITAFKPRRVIERGSWWWQIAELRNQGKI